MTSARGARLASSLLAVALGSVPVPAQELGNVSEPFSFRELREAGTGDLAPLRALTASDGVTLAYRAYLPEHATAALVFYHGGGAHSAKGYSHLAAGLRDDPGVAVYTPDLRGHGESGGERGDAPNPEQLLRDVGTLVDFARAAHPDRPVFVGGHSSGAGLSLNYASWPRHPPVDGYIFLSPQLGYRSDTDRKGAQNQDSSFVEVRTVPFIVNAMSGGRLMGHTKAVLFNYPPEVFAADPSIVRSYTVNFANGVTPQAPQDQFAGLDHPFGLWIGSEDELFEPRKVTSFGLLAEGVRKGSTGEVIPGRNHLDILVSAHEFIGPWLAQRVRASAAMD